MDPLRPLLRWLTALAPASFRERTGPRLRALLVLFHVLAIVSVSCPAPVRVGSVKQWDRPSIKTELSNWRGRLASLGIHMSENELRDFGRAKAQQWTDLRTATLRPFMVYVKKIGAPQGWYMFTAPDRNPQRLAVELIKEGGAHEPVFTLGRSVARPDIVTAGFLGEHRVRRVLFQTAWADKTSTFQDVCAWIGRRALAHEPTLQEIECTQVEFQVEHPWKVEKLPPEQIRNSLRLPMSEAGTAEQAQQRELKKKRKAVREKRLQERQAQERQP